MENFFNYNPICPGNQLCDRGDIECFKLIDFDNIRPIYYISTYGRIFSSASKKIMHPVLDGGYFRLVLRLNNGKTKSYDVQRLVAKSFIPKTVEDIKLCRDFVNHKNLVRCDNHWSNLEWVTPSENTQHAFQNNAHGKQKIINHIEPVKSKWGTSDTVGEDIGMSRLTDDQVHLICQALQDNCSYEECCFIAGMENNKHNKNIICNIKAGRRWQHISSQYNINKEMRDITDYSQYIIPVCKLLEKRKRIVDIIKELKIPGNYDRVRMFISGIKNKKSYLDISAKFNF